MEHIIALFQTESAAAAAERALEGAGFPASTIRRYTPGEMKKLEPESFADSTEASHSSSGGFWAWLWGEDVDTSTTRSAYSTEGDVYDRRARAGNIILSVTLDDDALIQKAIRILDAHHPLEIDEHTHESDTSGSFVQRETAEKSSTLPSGADYSTSVAATPAAGRTQESDVLPAGIPGSGHVGSVASSTARDEVIPLAEEQLEVGKRTIDRGTTRVRRYVVEKPSEQNVTLHGERVTIERRHPVEGTTASGEAFEERTVEVHETEEVPVVGKTARVVEEVAIRKEATERTETVKDTVRREEVEVTGNNVPPQSPPPPA
jgi:uncharacterized protein (TIGR02271 family)